MDTATLIVTLSVHLAITGCLLLVVNRFTPRGEGLAWFGSGCILFGVAYAGRLAIGFYSVGVAAAALDSTLVLAMLLFLAGLARFNRRRPPPAWSLGVAMAAFMVASLTAMTFAGPVGRHALLNAALGSAQFGFAVCAWRLTRTIETPQRRPLLALGGLYGLVGLFTLARSVIVVAFGLEPVFEGWLAQTYTAIGSLVAVLLAPLLLWKVFLRLNGRLAELATRDPLTRLLNRSGLDNVVRRHFGTRHPLPVSVLQIDVDHFKRINDAHGHTTGDAVLQAMADTLRRSMRMGDFAARTGGEEFLVGCVSAQPDVASALADRLRNAVAAMDVEVEAGALRCTISVGVSSPVTSFADWEPALRQADIALYAAKHAGRDRVVLAELDLGHPLPPVGPVWHTTMAPMLDAESSRQALASSR